jgi:hypothetical protein
VGSEAKSGEKSLEVLGAVVQVAGDGAPRAESVRPQRAGQAGSSLLEFPPRDGPCPVGQGRGGRDLVGDGLPQGGEMQRLAARGGC